MIFYLKIYKTVLEKSLFPTSQITVFRTNYSAEYQTHKLASNDNW